MKTLDLAAMLAMGADLERVDAPRRRLVYAIGFGAAGSTILMLLLMPVNPDLGNAVHLLKFWEKVVFVGAIAGAALLAVTRLSRPGIRLGQTLPGLMAPVLAMWILAAMTLLDADPAERGALFLGKTWAVCPFLIALLATPVFAATLWAMRGLAPTRLRLAGAAAGLLSGAAGALVYCFHCPELEAPFIAFWYLLGILIPTVIGTVFGDKLLRW